jgi:hypothetical protein
MFVKADHPPHKGPYLSPRQRFLVHIENLHAEAKGGPRCYVRERGAPAGEYVCEATDPEWARVIAQALDIRHRVLTDPLDDPQ